jgi:hypothetical protein
VSLDAAIFCLHTSMDDFHLSRSPVAVLMRRCEDLVAGMLSIGNNFSHQESHITKFIVTHMSINTNYKYQLLLQPSPLLVCLDPLFPSQHDGPLRVSTSTSTAASIPKVCHLLKATATSTAAYSEARAVQPTVVSPRKRITVSK